MPLILFLSLALAFGTSWFATPMVQSRNKIEGRVTGADGKPLGDMRVSLQNEGYSPIATILTDASGRFHFDRLGGGVYYVEVEPGTTGYERQKQRVEVVAFNERRGGGGGGEVFYVTMVMTGKRASKGSDSTEVSGRVLFHQEVPEVAKREYERGRKSLEKNDFADAVSALQHAITLFPDYFEALELLGTEYVKHNDHALALPLLQHAVEINKDSWRGFYSLGIAQSATNNRSEGIKSLQRAVELNPESPNTNMRLGLVLAPDPQMREAAIQALEKATRLSKEPIPMAYFYLGGLYAKNEQYRQAADAFKTLLRLEPNIGERDKIEKMIALFQQKAKEQNKK
jgi:cytochrome c-type biogenesis protein CcmH/NrfG